MKRFVLLWAIGMSLGGTGWGAPPPPGPIRISCAEFEYPTVTNAPTGYHLADAVNAMLSDATGLEVLERGRIAQLLDEATIDMLKSGGAPAIEVDQDFAGLNYLVFGSIQVMQAQRIPSLRQTQVTLEGSFRLVDVRTGRVALNRPFEGVATGVGQGSTKRPWSYEKIMKEAVNRAARDIAWRIVNLRDPLISPLRIVPGSFREDRYVQLNYGQPFLAEGDALRVVDGETGDSRGMIRVVNALEKWSRAEVTDGLDEGLREKLGETDLNGLALEYIARVEAATAGSFDQDGEDGVWRGRWYSERKAR